MIIDQFGVFFDDEAVAASMTGKSVSLQPHAGRAEPLYINILARGANSAPLTFSLSLEQSADNSSFTPAGGLEIVKPDAAPVLKAVRLPAEVTEKYVRLSAAVSGTPAGTLFAAFARDHFAPYAKGLYINKGKAEA